MKKVIFLILLIFLVIPLHKLKALDTVLPINENIKINSITKKYKWYKLKKIDSREENVFEHSCEYLEKKETEFSDWSPIYPEDIDGRIIEYKTVKNDTKINNDIKFVVISNIYTKGLKVREIELINDNNSSINYNISCPNCSYADLVDNVKDGNPQTTYDNFINSSTIYLFPFEYISINARVRIIYDNNGEDCLYGFTVSYYDENGNLKYEREETIKTLVFGYSPVYISYTNSKLKIDESVENFYRYKDSYLLCYEKEYLEDYYDSYEEYVKDEDKYILEYDYEFIKPETIETFKEIIVPKEKITYKYVEKENTETCQYANEEPSYLEENHDTQIQDSKSLNRKLLFALIFSAILSLIIILFMFMYQLIKKCR